MRRQQPAPMSSPLKWVSDFLFDPIRLGLALLGRQVQGLKELRRHVRDLLATEGEVVEGLALDGEPVPIPL